ncbi:MAG: hypothetical protein IH899_21380 [Planctomycetes bacterium]|nr:hypothetical protein [Planctomycetota bacterium]
MAVDLNHNTFVTTSGRNKNVQVWDLKKRRPIGKPLPHVDQLRELALSPDGKTLITIINNHPTALLWDLVRQRPLGPGLAHKNMVNAVAFSPDGTTVVTVENNTNNAHLWDVATSLPCCPPLNHSAIFNLAAFSPDGKFVVLGGGLKRGTFYSSSYSGRPLLVWKVPPAVPDDPERLRMWVELQTGQRLHADGTRLYLSPHERLSHQDRFQKDGYPVLP